MKLKDSKNRDLGFKVLEDECVWMKAGVVNFHLCDNAFDCRSCAFDKGMQRAMKKDQGTKADRESSGWAGQLRKKYGGASRPCRHAITGRISATKICTRDYECYHCSFDQMLDDMDVGEVQAKPGYEQASGFRLASGYYYHKGHSWARIEHGGRVKVGFDDFMVRLFGSATYLSLPPLGAKLKKGDVALTFERDDHKADVLAPVSGTVLAVNCRAFEHPQITHEDPYYEGWLYVVEPRMPKISAKGLYFGKKSAQWMDRETQQLMKLMGPEYENLAATGAEPIGDFYGSFPQIGWDVLTHQFLKTQRH